MDATRVSSDAAPSPDDAIALKVPAGGIQGRFANAGPSRPSFQCSGRGAKWRRGGVPVLFFALHYSGAAREVGVYLCAKAFITSGFASSGSHFFPMAAAGWWCGRSA